MKRIALVSAVCLLLAAPVSADAILNGGFETGTTAGWTLGSGYWTGGWPIDPALYLPGGARYNAAYQQGAVVTPGADPIVGAGLNRVYAGNYAYRVNNTYNDYSVGVITQTVNNYTDPTLYFEWAAVLEASHGLTDSDNFTLKVNDLTDGTNLVTRSYSSASAPGIFNQTGSWYWTPWQVENIDTSGRIGHDLQVLLLGADCPYGGHAGYVYLDGFAPIIVPPGPVPEPASLLLFGTAMAGLIARRRYQAA